MRKFKTHQSENEKTREPNKKDPQRGGGGEEEEEEGEEEECYKPVRYLHRHLFHFFILFIRFHFI